MRIGKGPFGLALLLVVADAAPVTRLEVVSFGAADSIGLQGYSDSTTPNYSMRNLSRDGRHVAFVSLANTLVSGDSNNVADIFVRDRQLGVTTRESLGSGGVQANAASEDPALTANGRVLVFSSDASNLVGGDSNAAKDIFVRDRLTGNIGRVSVDSAGTQGNALSDGPSLSADGRYVVYLSLATNLVSGDSNGVADIFVHDRQTGLTTRASVSSAGVQGNGASATPIISPDGRYVAFYSWSNNLVGNDLNAQPDVFVRDLQTATTVLISVSSGGVQGNAGSFSPALSADGRYVAFESNASNLVGGDSNAVSDVFLRDRVGNTTTRISIDSLGQQANGASNRVAISEDGNLVSFDSAASNLVIGDANAVTDVFLRNRAAGTTVHASYNNAGVQANNTSRYAALSGDGSALAYQSDATNLGASDTNARTDVFVFDLAHALTSRVSVPSDIAANDDSMLTTGLCCLHRISADGKRIAFHSEASNLVVDDGNGRQDVFVFDRVSGGTLRASISSAGVQGNAASADAGIAADGRFVAFDSAATNLVTADSNGVSDVFVHDLLTRGTERVSVDSAEVQGNGASSGPAVSADGRTVAFQSVASNLVGSDTNGSSDIFVRDRTAGTTLRASVSSAGAQGNGGSLDVAISDNGRYVAFASLASNLVLGDSNSTYDIFVRDLQLGSTTRVSVDSAGAQANGASSNQAISADGRYIAFESAASNLVSGDGNGARDTFVHDRVSGATTRVSVSSAGVEANGFSFSVAISADGRFVAFESAAGNLYPGDTNGLPDVFVRDRLLATTTLVSMDRNGTRSSGNRSERPSISADGGQITFQSDFSGWALDAGVDHPAGPTGVGYDVFVAEAPVDVIFRDGYE